MAGSKIGDVENSMQEILKITPDVASVSVFAQNRTSDFDASFLQLRPSNADQDLLETYERTADVLSSAIQRVGTDADDASISRIDNLAAEIDTKFQQTYFPDKPSLQTMQKAVQRAFHNTTAPAGAGGESPTQSSEAGNGPPYFLWILLGCIAVCAVGGAAFWFHSYVRSKKYRNQINQANEALKQSEQAAKKLEEAAKKPKIPIVEGDSIKVLPSFVFDRDVFAEENNRTATPVVPTERPGDVSASCRPSVSRGVPPGKSLWPNVDGSRPPPPPPPAEKWKFDIRGLGLKPSRVKGTAMPVVPHDLPEPGSSSAMQTSAASATPQPASAHATLQLPIPNVPSAPPPDPSQQQTPDPERPDPNAPFSQPTPQPGTAVRPAPGTGTEWVERDDLPSPVNIHGGIDSGITVMGVLVQSAYFDHPPESVLLDHARATGTAPPPPPSDPVAIPPRSTR